MLLFLIAGSGSSSGGTQRSASASRPTAASGIPGAGNKHNNNSMLDKFKFFKDKDKSKAGGTKAASSAKCANGKGKDKRLGDEGGAGASESPAPEDSKLPNGNVSRLVVSETGAAGSRESQKPDKDSKEKKSSKLLGSKSRKQEVTTGATTTSQTESVLQKRASITASKSVSGSLLKKANGSSSAKLQPSSSIQAKLDKSAAAVPQRESSPSQTKKGVTKIAGINKANLSGKTKSSASSSTGSTLSLGGPSSASSGIPGPGLTSIPKPGSRSSSKTVGKADAKTRSVSREKSRDQLTKRESAPAEASIQGRPVSPMGRSATPKQQQMQQQQRLQQQQHQQALQQQKAQQQQEQQRRTHGDTRNSTGQYGIRPGDTAQAHAEAVAQHHAAQQEQAKLQKIQQQQHQLQQQAKQQQVQQQHQLQQQLQQQQQQRLSHGSMIAMGKHAKTAHPSKISQGLSQHPRSPVANAQPQVTVTSQQHNEMTSQPPSSKVMTSPVSTSKPMKVDSDTQTNVSAINRVLTPSKDVLTRGINVCGIQPAATKGPSKDQSNHSLTSNESATVSSGGESGGNSHSTSNSNNSHSSNDSIIFRPSSADDGESGLESDSNRPGQKQRIVAKQQSVRPPVQDHISSLRKNSTNTQGRMMAPVTPQGRKMETTFDAGDVRTETKNVPKTYHTNSPKETTFAEKDESDDVLMQNIKPMQPILRASPYAYLNIGKPNALPRPSLHISTTLSSQVSSLAHSQSASSRLGVNRPLIDPSKYSLTHLNAKWNVLSSSRSVQDDDCASDADSTDLAAGYMSDGDILRSNHLDDINRYSLYCIITPHNEEYF